MGRFSFSGLFSFQEGNKKFFTVIIGMSLFSGLALMGLQLFQFNADVFSIVAGLTVIYISSWLIFRFVHERAGYHFFLVGSISTYLYIPLFTEVSYFSGPLLFPILTLVAINLFRSRLASFFYSILCGITLCVVLNNFMDESTTTEQLFVEFVVAGTFFFAFYVIGEQLIKGWRNNNDEILRREQELREKQSRIEEQNVRLKQNNTDLERAREEMAAKNAELERYIESNQQLQNFAFTASHDLRAPLSAILAMVEVLGEAAGPKLDTTEHRYLQLIRERGENMQQLMEALLEYSRVDSQQLKPERVALTPLLDSLQQDLATVLEAQNGRIAPLDSLPEDLVADPVKLRQLFQNLIANGLKFAREGVPPVVEISARYIGTSWVIAFRDNGIGIPADQIQQIFTMFERLHSQQEFQGTGIGLALVQKLVDQHGGRVWVESAPGEGSTFFVELPQPAD